MNADLQEFVETVCDAMTVRVGHSSAAGRIAEHVRISPRLERAVTPGQLPGCSFLAEAVRLAQSAEDPVIARIARMIEAQSPRLPWMLRTGLPGAAEDFPLRHANAMFVGDNGLETSDVTVGVTIMGPNTVYTDHSHPPEETYLVLSPGEWRQNAGPWREPGVGGVVYNPPGIIHSMRAGNEPLLAVWLLRPADPASAAS